MEQSTIINLSDADLDWLKANFPSLQVSEEDSVIHLRGLLDFDLFYDKENRQMLYYPPAEYADDKYRIQDIYEVEIIFTPNKNSLLPQVRETGGRLQTLAAKFEIDIIDLHVQQAAGGTLCLCARQDELRRMPNGLNLDVLFHELIIPFFYSNSFFERFETRPWRDFAHGVLGTLEFYEYTEERKNLDLVKATLKALQEEDLVWKAVKNLLQKAPNPAYARCFCTAKGTFGQCHKNALAGLLKLKKEIKYFKLSL